MKKVVVDVDEVLDIIKKLAEINGSELTDLKFVRNGIEMVPTQLTLDEWKYVGLNNLSFIKEIFLQKEVDEINKTYFK